MNALLYNIVVYEIGDLEDTHCTVRRQWLCYLNKVEFLNRADRSIEVALLYYIPNAIKKHF